MASAAPTVDQNVAPAAIEQIGTTMTSQIATSAVNRRVRPTSGSLTSSARPAMAPSRPQPTMAQTPPT